MMDWLRKLNPINHLFGRIFLWFWLVTFLMLSSGIWLAKQLSSGYELEPINPKRISMLQNTADKLVRYSEKRDGGNLSLLLGRMGHKNRQALILVDLDTSKFIYGFPRPMQPDKEPFIKILKQDTPFTVKTATGRFHGPQKLTLNEKQYALFVGRPLPMGTIQKLRRQHPGAVLTFAIILSGAFCALLAWSLLRPIRELQSAANRMSQGDLTTRVGSVSKRHDELGQLAKDFNQMSQQLEQLVGSHKRLLGDISHELRSPLARLQVAIGIAQQQDPQLVTQVTEKQLARIEKEAGQIEHMIAQLLKLSRLESSSPSLTKEKTNITQLLSDVVNDADFEAQSLSKDVVFTTDKQVDAEIERDLIASALSNVVRNAVKYASKHVRVSQTIEDSVLCIDVSDDGTGIADEELGDIFRPFYRLSASRNRDSGGVGLGLAIAQRAVLSHEGTIEASNIPSGGLKVTIRLPIVHNGH